MYAQGEQGQDAAGRAEKEMMFKIDYEEVK
jgi:hypothetical protein